MSDLSAEGEAVSRMLDRGLVRYAMGLRDEAIVFWQDALEQSPGNARALDYLQSVGALSPSALDPDVDLSPVQRIESAVGMATLDRAGDSLLPPFIPEPSTYDDAEEDNGAGTGDSIVVDVDILVREAKEREASGDFEVALKNCEDALRRDPEHEEALALVATLRVELEAVYLKELEPLSQIPYLRATDSSILELSLDPVGGFLISQIDGEITLEELLLILGTFDQFRVLSSLHYILVNEIIELR